MYNANPTSMPASNLSVGSVNNVIVCAGQQRLLSHLYSVSKKFVKASKLSARTACPVHGRDSSVGTVGSCVVSDNYKCSDCVPVHVIMMSLLMSGVSESKVNATGGAAEAASSNSKQTRNQNSSTKPSIVSPFASYMGEDPLLSAIPIEADRVSLPSRLSSVPLTSLLPNELAAAYAAVNSNMILIDFPVQTDANQTASCRSPQFYGERTEYLKLLHRMRQLNMIAFTTSPRAINGLFGVPKDVDGIRLIIDATPANKLFVPCPHVQLPDPSLLARLCVDKGDRKLWMAKADLESFYHQLLLPEWLQQFFALPGIRKSEMVAAGLIGVDQFGVRDDFLVYPMCTTLPMGWSHSVFVSQAVHEFVLYHIGKLNPNDNVIHLKSPLIDRSLHAVYIDDFGVLSDTEDGCNRSLNVAITAYATAGLALKMSKLRRTSRDPVQLLGMCIDGYDYSITLPPERMRRLVLLTADTLTSESVSGRHMQKLIGLWTWQLLIVRPGLSILQNVYRFIRVIGDTDSVLWPSVRQELIALIAVLPLLRISMVSRWSSTLVATDASEIAAGVVSTDLTAELFHLLWPISVSRRTVHNHIETLTRRRRSAVDAVAASDVVVGLSLVQPSVALTQNSETLVSSSSSIYTNYYMNTITSSSLHWRTLISSTWRWSSHINQLELKAVVLALRRLFSSPAIPGTRLMFLSDSAVVTYALTKGRSSSKGMVRGMKQVAALLLSSGCRFGVAWIPTEVNPADAPSRNPKFVKHESI
jgi:hypothetical protein